MPTDTANVYETAASLFHQEGLTLPPVPAVLADLPLAALSANVFATAPLTFGTAVTEADASAGAVEDAESDTDDVENLTAPTGTAAAPEIHQLTNVEDVLDNLLTGGLPTPFLALGYDGHGFASTAIHYYVATPQVVLLLQHRWATVQDVDAPQAAIDACDVLLEWTAEIAELAAAAAADGIFPTDRRLVALESSFHQRRYAWVPKDVTRETLDTIEWQVTSTYALVAALSMVENIRRGLSGEAG